jgi:hypothetical protein
MSYQQQAHNCPSHDNCTAIICLDDTTGATVWASHDTDTVDPAGRINPDHPAYDHTGDGDPVPITPTPPAAAR